MSSAFQVLPRLGREMAPIQRWARMEAVNERFVCVPLSLSLYIYIYYIYIQNVCVYIYIYVKGNGQASGVSSPPRPMVWSGRGWGGGGGWRVRRGVGAVGWGAAGGGQGSQRGPGSYATQAINPIRSDMFLCLLNLTCT